jgi:hypothetical protein
LNRVDQAGEGDNALAHLPLTPDTHCLASTYSRVRKSAKKAPVSFTWIVESIMLMVCRQEVVDAADGASVSFVDIGPVEPKGARRPLRLHTAGPASLFNALNPRRR